MTDGYTLLIDCSDRKGLVHAITGVLFRQGLNITSNGEFVDHDSGHFFMRTEFDGELDVDAAQAELRSLLPEDSQIRFAPKGKKKIMVMATTEPHCLGDLLVRYAYEEINADILAVISNHLTLKPLVDGFKVPFYHQPHAGLSREEHEAGITALIEKHDPEYIVLAKYMRILTPGFVRRYHNRIINIHHSFLPAFIGANPYRQAYDRGVKIIGATSHFVNDNLDEGPIVTQEVIAVDHSDSPEDMRQAGRDVEKTVLARALKLVFEDRVFISGNKTIIFD